MQRKWLMAVLLAGSGFCAVARADSARPVRTIADALTDAAAVVEGRVVDIQYTYDAVAGPRTITTLAVAKTHAGVSPGARVRLATLGGPLPDGRVVTVSELPQFRLGSSYVVFLTASDWFYTPVVADYAFRVAPIGQREVLVNTTGTPVIGVNEHGIELAEHSVERSDHEWLRHTDPPILLPEAELYSARAVTKDVVVDQIKRLGLQMGTGGEFKPAVASGRSWNRIEVAHEPVKPGVKAPEKGGTR